MPSVGGASGAGGTTGFTKVRLGSVFSGPGPLVSCDGVMDVRFEARRKGKFIATWPRSGGFAPLPRSASVVALDETFATAAGWTASGEPSRGGWEWAVPSGGGLRNDAPADVAWDGDEGSILPLVWDGKIEAAFSTADQLTFFWPRALPDHRPHRLGDCFGGPR